MNTKRYIKFYMAGGMSNLSHEEQFGWRLNIQQSINCLLLNCNTYFFIPPYYYRPDGNYHKSEREAMEFDLYNLRSSDVVIVNFNTPSSIGTAMELAIAKELRIPVIGLNEDGKELHPWLTECCTRICETKTELIDHIKNFYLI